MPCLKQSPQNTSSNPNSSSLSTFWYCFIFLWKNVLFSEITQTQTHRMPQIPNPEFFPLNSSWRVFVDSKTMKSIEFYVNIWYWRGGRRNMEQKFCTAEYNKVELVNFWETYNNFPSRASKGYENFMEYDIWWLLRILSAHWGFCQTVIILMLLLVVCVINFLE